MSVSRDFLLAEKQAGIFPKNLLENCFRSI